ncbi:MAG: hypothetical protein HZC26_02835 [Candidatus Magasanikbacteria bacterium]|nr:hypothetical protein [Candidatus Magasanikbacteria bacterium]
MTSGDVRYLTPCPSPYKGEGRTASPAGVERSLGRQFTACYEDTIFKLIPLGTDEKLGSYMINFFQNEIKKQNNVKYYEEKITPAVFKIKDNSRAYIMGDVKTNIDTIADIDESSLYVQTGDVKQNK